MGSEQSYLYMKRWHYERAHGLTRTTAAGPIAAHLQELLDAGWSLRSIADAAGCSPSSVQRVVTGRQQRIRNDIAARLAAVDDAAILARQNALGFVRKLGARRRIQGLLAIGWRHEDITAAMLAAQPVCGTPSAMVLHQRGEWIARRTHDAVVGAYEQLSMTPGPSGKTRRLAAKYGYEPPLAWDDASIDDPDARPELGTDDAADLDEVLIERIMAGTYRVAANTQVPEKIEAIRRLAGRGLPDSAIAERLGTTTGNIGWTRSRHGIASQLGFSTVGSHRHNRTARSASSAVRATQSEDAAQDLSEDAQTA